MDYLYTGRYTKEAYWLCVHYSELQLARWRLKSPASRLFSQPFIQGADQRKQQSSAFLAFLRGIHRWPMTSPHKGSVTRKVFPFDDVIISLFFVVVCQRSALPTLLRFLTLGLFGRRVIVVTCVCPSVRLSVCPSVRLSVCLSVCSHHPC